MRLRNKQVNACGETFAFFFSLPYILAATEINTILSAIFLRVVYDCQMVEPFVQLFHFVCFRRSCDHLHLFVIYMHVWCIFFFFYSRVFFSRILRSSMLHFFTTFSTLCGGRDGVKFISIYFLLFFFGYKMNRVNCNCIKIEQINHLEIFINELRLNLVHQANV